MLNQKFATCCIVVISAALFTACQPKQTPTEPSPSSQAQPSVASEPKAIESPRLEGGLDKLRFELPNCDANSCPEVSIERLQSNQNFIDQYIDQKIVQHVNDILSVLPQYKRINEKLQDMPTDQGQMDQLKAKLQQPIELFLKLDQELKDLNVSHKISLVVKPRIINAGQPLATVMLNSNHYLGGAHGSATQQYYNFDLKQQKLIQLNDILQPNQRAQLEKLAHQAYRVWIVESQLAEHPDEYEQAWTFNLTDNFYLSPQGLVLQYSEYEIGPYVVGLPRLILPYSELQTVLQPQYLPSINPQQGVASEPKS